MSKPISEKRESFDVISIEIFEKIFQKVFNVKNEGDIWKVDLKNIDKNNLILLFFWPLTIAKRYLCPYMEIDLFKKQCDLNNILASSYNLDEIYNHLNYFGIDSELYEDNYYNFEEAAQRVFNNKKDILSFSDLCIRVLYDHVKESGILEKLNKQKNSSPAKVLDLAFGEKESIIHGNPPYYESIPKKAFYAKLIEGFLEDNAAGQKIVNGIFYYYLVLLIYLSNYNNNPSSNKNDTSLNCIEFEEIFNFINDYEKHFGEQCKIILLNSFRLLLNFGVYKFEDTIRFFIKDYKSIFLQKESSEDVKDGKYKFHRNNPDYIAQIDENEDGEDFSITVTRLMKIFDDMDYGVYFWFEKDFEFDVFNDHISFECNENLDPFPQMLHCLYLIGKRLSIHINNYADAYKKFISNAEILIDQDLDTFLNTMDLITGSYSLFEEYIEHKDFSMAIENLDMNLDDDRIEKFRKKLKKDKKEHLPPQLIKDLLTANNEISILYSMVNRKPEIDREAIAKKYFVENSHCFKILNKKDLKFIDYNSDVNRRRNTRRLLLYNIVKRAGKELAGYRIAQELGLKSG